LAALASVGIQALFPPSALFTLAGMEAIFLVLAGQEYTAFTPLMAVRVPAEVAASAQALALAYVVAKGATADSAVVVATREVARDSVAVALERLWKLRPAFRATPFRPTY
jgi:hypothetical protein